MRDIALLYHIQEVSSSIGSNFKSKVYLKGQGSLATALQLENRLLSKSITVTYLAKENLQNADLVDSFKNADPASDDERRSFVFRGMILIPLFVSMPIIDLY